MSDNPSQASGVAFIVGASCGLGHGLARGHLRRGWRVIATVRDSGHSTARRTPLHGLKAEAGDALEIESVDINVLDQVAALRQRLDGRSTCSSSTRASRTTSPRRSPRSRPRSSRA